MTRSKKRPVGFALYYATKLGWPVFPVHYPINGKCSCQKRDCKSIGKHPIINQWQERASTDPEVIRTWWREYPEANIGILTGRRSKLLVLDVDPRNGGMDSLKEILKKRGRRRLLNTLSVRTGGDGLHLFLLYPDGLAKLPKQLARGIDIKGDGGFIVTAPSRHAFGKLYRWRKKPRLDTLEPVPHWIFPFLQKSKTTKDLSKPSNSAVKRISEGGRNDYLARMAGALRYRGLRAKGIYAALKGINRTLCDPPLEKEEVAQIAKSIGRYPSGSKLNNGEIQTMTALELIHKDIPELKWLIPTILPQEGLVIVAGVPKIGKSWFVFSLCHAISIGGSILGYDLEKGTAIYLALEDSERRLQRRMRQFSQGRCNKRLVLATKIPRADLGGMETLERLIQDHPDCKLVAIDTWGRFAPTPEGRKSQYQNDYDAYAAVQELAIRYGVPILVITHLRKAPSADPLQEVSGTMGVTGATDTLLIFKRDRVTNTGQLFITGRDVDEQQLAVDFNRQTGLWSILGEVEEVFISQSRRDILNVLGGLGSENALSPKDLAAILEKPDGSIRKLLFDMERSGQVFKADRGKYYGNTDNKGNNGN